MEITDIINACIGSDSNQFRFMSRDKADKQELHDDNTRDKLSMVSNLQSDWFRNREYESYTFERKYLLPKFYQRKGKLCNQVM